MMRRAVATFAPDHEMLTVEHDQPEIIQMTVAGVVHVGMLCGAFNLSVHTLESEQLIVMGMTMPARPIALYQAFDAASARTVAAHLCKMADQIDGGAGKQ